MPVIPSPPAWGGMECYGRSQAGSIKKMACDGPPRHRRTIEVRQRELEEVLMGIVGGFDVHRQQITFDYVDTDTGQLCRAGASGDPSGVAGVVG